MKIDRSELLLRVEVAVLLSFMAIPALLTFAGTAESAEPAKPVGFQGVDLGQTLQETKQRGFLSASGRQTPIRCSDEPTKSFLTRVSPEEKDAGLVRCIPASSVTGDISIQPLSVTPSISAIVGLQFVDGVLVDISAEYNAFDAEIIEAGLTEKYGKPETVKLGKIETRAGNWYDKRTVAWKLGDSTISLHNPGLHIDRMIVIYETPGAEAFRRKVTASAGAKADL